MVAQPLVIVYNNFLEDIFFNHLLQRRSFQFTEKAASFAFVLDRDYDVTVIVDNVAELFISIATLNAVIALYKKSFKFP
jgi:hypothetical protein